MKDKLKAQMKSAMREKDKLSVETIRSLLSAIQYAEMNKKTDELSEEQTLQVINSELKKQKESLEYAEKDGRTEMIDETRLRIACIEQFLPSQLSEEKLSEVIKTFVQNNAGANVGQIMQYLKSDFGGQYDGKIASQLAKSVCG